MSFPHGPSRGATKRAAGILIWIAFLMASILLTAACSTEGGEEPESVAPKRTVTVTGTGSVEAEADVIRVMSGFWVKEEDANLAIFNSAERLEKIKAAMNDLGISPADIYVPGASMNSEQIFGADGYPTERLLYAVNQSLNITVRDVTRVGDVLNSLRVTAGAPYLFSLVVQPELSPERQTLLLLEAQRLALSDALAGGRDLAQQMGLALGDPVEVTTLNRQVNVGPILQGQVSLQVRYTLE